MSRTFAKAAAAVFAAIGTIIMAPLAIAQQPTALNIHQDVPVLAEVDLGASSNSPGDLLAFEAGITAEDGTTGTLSGILITIDLPGDGDDVFEDRIGQLVFDLGSSNSILVAGESVYAETTTEMNADQPQLRAVIGGTGQYIGARGQVTTTRNADGTYEHAFELIK